MRVEMPLGDVVDRATILRIKVEQIPAARALILAELDALTSAWAADGLPPMEDLADYGELAQVNRALWEVEDRLREHEGEQSFGPSFVELARSVYRLNDLRAALKRNINDLLASRLVEVKSYSGQRRGIVTGSG